MTTLLIKEKENEIIKIFKQDFPRFYIGKNHEFKISINGQEERANYNTINQKDSISLKTEDGQIELLINCDSVIFSIEGKKYKNFENSINDVLDKIVMLFELLSIQEITSCSLRKINLIEFGYNVDQPPNGILNVLLNKSIVYNEDAFNGLEFITKNIHNLEFKDGDYTLILKYGMNTLSLPDKKIGQLIVDNQISFDSIISSIDLNSKMKIINEELFNVFFWMFNDITKNALRDGKFNRL